MRQLRLPHFFIFPDWRHMPIDFRKDFLPGRQSQLPDGKRLAKIIRIFA
jgi:hypothetical protein